MARSAWRVVVLTAMAGAVAVLVPPAASAAQPVHGIWGGSGYSTTTLTLIVSEDGRFVDNFFGGFYKPDAEPQSGGRCGITAGPYNRIPIAPDGSFAWQGPANAAGAFRVAGRFTSPVTAEGVYSFTYDCQQAGPGPVSMPFRAVLVDDLRPERPRARPKPRRRSGRRRSRRGARSVRICARAVADVRVFTRPGGTRTRSVCTRPVRLQRGSNGRSSPGGAPLGCQPLQAVRRVPGLVEGYESRGSWCRQLALAVSQRLTRPSRQIPLGTLTLVERLDDRPGGAVRVERWSGQQHFAQSRGSTRLRVSLAVSCSYGPRRSCGRTRRQTTLGQAGRTGSLALGLPRNLGREVERGRVSSALRLAVAGGPRMPTLPGRLATARFRGNRRTWVFPPFTPTAVFSRQRLPAIVDHMLRAQAAGKPGRPGGQPLVRVTGVTVRRNRQAACGAARRQWNAEGYSCEEYPFASTTAGGSGALIARVPPAEQPVQGAILSSFYSANQVLAGDRFYAASGP